MKLPKRVTLEFTNICNRNCTECPRNKTKMKLGYMTHSLFHKIIVQLPPQTVIVPFFRGESTLHPSFDHFIGELGTFKAIQLASNGDNLTGRNQKAILNNVSFFSLSLHNSESPTQKQLQFLQKLRKAKTKTQISTVGKPKNLASLYGLADRIRIYEKHSINNIADMHGVQIPVSPCSKPFSEMVILWDGNVALCNHDWNNLTFLGNIEDASISEIWNGEAYQNVRKLHKQEKRKEVASCKSCCFESGKIYGQILT